MKTMLDGKQIMTDPVVLDEAGDYKSLDAMASDLINAKIRQQFRNDPRLVVLVVLTWWPLNSTACSRLLTAQRRKSRRRCWAIPLLAVRRLSRRSCRVNAWW
jgi:hypothetical protein